MVLKTINIEGKTNLLSLSMVQEIYQWVSHGKRLYKGTKLSHWGISIKDAIIKESKTRSQPSTPQQFEEVFDKAWKKKKKEHRNHNQDYAQDQRFQKNFIPATRVNMLELGEPRKKKKNRKYLDQDMSIIKYYIYNKKGHYLSLCPKLSKN